MAKMTIQASNELQRCIEAAAGAGCPDDQARRFLQFGYVPQPKQWEFHGAAFQSDKPDGPIMVGLGGARGPGKSHAVMAQIGMDDCQRVPGLKYLFLRKVQKAAKESFEDLIGRVFRYLPHEYHSSEHRLLFGNGSRIIIGGFKDEKEIAGYLGIEYDGIAIEEATLISEGKFDMIQGSLRTSKDNWRPRMYLTTNPGGIGHQWFRERLVLPAAKHTETNTRFIFSTFRDNAYLNKEYVDYLLNLKGPLGKAWRDGDWDVFEGQAFPQFGDDHIISPAKVHIPDHWARWRAIDWGRAAPFCCLWCAKDPDNGRIYVYRELYQAGLTVRDQARLILEYTPPNERIAFTYADPAMWAKRDMLGVILSTADEYAQEGIYLTKADNDRLSGKRKIDTVLAPLPDGAPGLQVFEQCTNLIRTIPLMIHDAHNKEDIDTTLEDHAVDTLKYLLTNYKIVLDPTNKQHGRHNPLSEALL